MLMRRTRGWEILEFASFAQYCEERLGMAPRTVIQRARLERSLHEIPLLRAAMREKRISYEKARLLARDLDPGSIAGWIERAEAMTCIELRRTLEEEDERQMCARGALRLWLPASVAAVASAAFRAARREAGRWISPTECLLRIADHFIEVWKPRVAQKKRCHAGSASETSTGARSPAAAVQPRSRITSSSSPRAATTTPRTRPPSAPSTTCAPSTLAACGSPAPRPTSCAGCSRMARSSALAPVRKALATPPDLYAARRRVAASESIAESRFPTSGQR
jgi:hypothetical protein